MKRALYAGSFDPFTKGHLDILKRATRLFDEVIIAIGMNISKSSFFTAEEKKQMIQQVIEVEKLSHVSVVYYNDELTVHLAEREKAQFMIRGIRSVKDLEYEMDIASMNKIQNPQIESVFLMSAEQYRFISSSMIKEVAKFGGDISEIVPPIVEEQMLKKLN